MHDKLSLDLQSLKDIINLMKQYNVAEICLKQNDIKIHVKLSSASISYPSDIHMPQDISTASHEPDLKDSVFISAPMVGTFYRSPSPDAPPYVEVGSEVKAGQVICIIEAMKLMNEITADFDCYILQILVNNGQAVEYDQPLFRVKPI